MKKAGFTLWELLAVIIIILFLFAILFPFGYGHHEKARQITCASNMKQLGLAITQYEQDNDEQMPNIADANNANVTWRTMIYPYAKNKALFLCPDHDKNANAPDGFPISYAANYTGNYSGGKKDWGQGAFAGPGSKPLSTFFLPDAASLIELCEIWHSNRPDFNIDNLGAFNPGSDMLWAGHDNGSNYLFDDGHMRYWNPLQTKSLWHRNASLPLSAGSMKVLQNAYKSEAK